VAVGRDRAGVIPDGDGRLVAVRPYLACLVLLDALAAASAATLGQWVRFDSSSATAASGVPYLVVVAALPVAWVVTVMLTGGYDRGSLSVGVEEYRRVAGAGVWLLAALAVTSYVSRSDLSRGFVAVTVPLATAFSLLSHQALRRVLHLRIRRGGALHRVLVVGSVEEVHGLARHIRRAPRSGLHAVGACVPGSVSGAGHLDGGLPVLGGVGDALDAVRRTGADTIAIAGTSALAPGQLRRLSWQLEGTGVQLVVAPSITDIAGPRIVVRPVQGLPLLHVEEPEFSGARRVLKEVTDRVGALLLAILCAPLMLGIALAIRLDSPGPVIFRQARVGRGGSTFVLWKFRTMCVDAPEQRLTLLPLNECEGPLFKMRADPRVTRMGRWLRRYSMDELPQLWNVLTGSMSLVGPRPPLPSEVDRFGDDARRRLLVKPGMTGLWQVSGRSDLSWEDALQLDLHYIENWSVSMDAMVLGKTVGAVLGGRGAY
jgi:exopolysaccharide biosynthesis polyprenyl glycosylphosphotransferase